MNAIMDILLSAMALFHYIWDVVLHNIRDILLSAIGSTFVLAVLYHLYWISFRHCSAKRAYAQCWWLPDWNCFRFVIRNMHSEENLMSIKYRAWLRSIQPARLGSSVKTFEDKEIASGERILLYGRQDLPVLCFRFEHHGNDIKFVRTDKFGTLIGLYDIKSEEGSLMIEYYLKIQSWFLFKHEIARVFEIPH